MIWVGGTLRQHRPRPAQAPEPGSLEALNSLIQVESTRLEGPRSVNLPEEVSPLLERPAEEPERRGRRE